MPTGDGAVQPPQDARCPRQMRYFVGNNWPAASGKDPDGAMVGPRTQCGALSAVTAPHTDTLWWELDAWAG
ncbi:hypothetical protein EYF80_028531 [Liparis tanakae]|uniref:Uncharacterized protein n=1 Tax=Liparis tanakae TaxID=230148 RepID=A0A4Z2H667_9TELE|nr:hypothetical protein EYF80_028531 [Liparis tanakae]